MTARSSEQIHALVNNIYRLESRPILRPLVFWR